MVHFVFHLQHSYVLNFYFALNRPRGASGKVDQGVQRDSSQNATRLHRVTPPQLHRDSTALLRMITRHT